MSFCVQNCKLCRNLVFSQSVTVVAIDGVDTLVIDIPAGFYPDCYKICLVITNTIPDTATISMPVVASIAGDTTTVYPLLRCDCTPVTACALRTRKKYAFRINTTPTGAVFKSLGGLSCQPNNNLAVIPAPTESGGEA